MGTLPVKKETRELLANHYDNKEVSVAMSFRDSSGVMRVYEYMKAWISVFDPISSEQYSLNYCNDIFNYVMKSKKIMTIFYAEYVELTCREIDLSRLDSEVYNEMGVMPKPGYRPMTKIDTNNGSATYLLKKGCKIPYIGETKPFSALRSLWPHHQ